MYNQSIDPYSMLALGMYPELKEVPLGELITYCKANKPEGSEYTYRQLAKCKALDDTYRGVTYVFGS